MAIHLLVQGLETLVNWCKGLLLNFDDEKKVSTIHELCPTLTTLAEKITWGVAVRAVDGTAGWAGISSDNM